MTQLLLPDFSEFQANASMPGVKKQNGGAVILRAHNGSREDYSFTAHRRAAQAAGFAFIGIYQYVAPAGSPVSQARALAAVIGKLAPNEIPVLDIEDPGFAGNLADWSNGWSTTVDSVLGIAGRPIQERSWVYSYPDFIQRHGLAPVFASYRRSWVASYGANPPSIGHSLWQCYGGGIGGSHAVNWSGAGVCDTSLFNGTLAQLAALIKATGQIPKPPVTPPPTADDTWPDSQTLVLHSSGGAVRVLQAMLRDSGITGVRGITVDGMFESQTLTAVKNFQAEAHLKVDGEAGPATHNALKALRAGAAFNVPQDSTAVTRAIPAAVTTQFAVASGGAGKPQGLATWETAGDGSLNDLAHQVGNEVGTILRLTIQWGGGFSPGLSAYLDGADFNAVLPAHLVLYYEKGSEK